MALCKPAATELESKKNSRSITDATESFTRIRFFWCFLFDLYFDLLLILIVPCRTRGISYGFCGKKNANIISEHESLESHESFLLIYSSTSKKTTPLPEGTMALSGVSLWDTVGIPMLHCWCKGAALLVQGCCTFTGTIIRKSLLTFLSAIAMIYCRYTYAVLSVSLCGTSGTRMLCFSGTAFSICLQAISRWI